MIWIHNSWSDCGAVFNFKTAALRVPLDEQSTTRANYLGCIWNHLYITVHMGGRGGGAAYAGLMDKDMFTDSHHIIIQIESERSREQASNKVKILRDYKLHIFPVPVVVHYFIVTVLTEVGKHPDLLVGLPTSTVFQTNDRNFERSQFF